MNRLSHERTFWDQIGEQELAHAHSAISTDVSEPWLSRITAALGDIRGQFGLDCGAGTGALSQQFLSRGAFVTAFDLSQQMLHAARRRASPGGHRSPDFVAADFAGLPFASSSFDFAGGSFILHHVGTAAAIRELHRVLRPGGRAVFSETWLANPLLAWTRTHIAGRFGVARYGTLTEHPITRADIDEMRRIFPHVRLHFPEFICFAKAGTNVFRWQTRYRPVTSTLVGLDRLVGSCAPPLRQFGYYCLVELEK